jgi:hypothetical protein
VSVPTRHVVADHFDLGDRLGALADQVALADAAVPADYAIRT